MALAYASTLARLRQSVMRKRRVAGPVSTALARVSGSVGTAGRTKMWEVRGRPARSRRALMSAWVCVPHSTH
jgi:hypothetical protein